MTARKLESHADVASAAVNIYFNGDLDPEAVETELDALVDRARRNGVDISVDELMEQLILGRMRTGTPFRIVGSTSTSSVFSNYMIGVFRGRSPKSYEM